MRTFAELDHNDQFGVFTRPYRTIDYDLFIYVHDEINESGGKKKGNILDGQAL